MKNKQINKKVNLPVQLEFSDYHEIDYVLNFFKEVIPGIKATKIGCDGMYQAVFYTGAITNPENKSIIDKVKKEIKEFETDKTNYRYYNRR